MLPTRWLSVSMSQPVIHPEPVTVEPGCSGSEAIARLQQAAARCGWVVHQRQLVGVVTDRELLQLGEAARITAVADVMSSQYPTLSEAQSSDPAAVLTMLQQHPIDEVAVVNSANQLLGVITSTAVLQALHWETPALSRSEKPCCSLFENSIEGIFQTTLDGRYLSVNPTLARMHGYDSPADMMASIQNIGQQLYVNPDRRQEFIRLIEKNDIAQGFESQVYRKDGSRMWISENAWVVRDAQGKVRYYEGTSIDISDRKRLEAERLRAEQALQGSELRYRALNAELEHRIAERTAELTAIVQRLQQEIADRQQAEAALQQNQIRFQQLAESVPGMIYHYIRYPDGSDALLYASPTCEELYGVSAEQALQNVDALWDLFLPEDQQRVRMILADSLTTFRPIQFEFRIITPAGQLKWLQVHSRPDRQPDGSAFWTGIVLDMTERKQIEEALRLSEARFRLAFNQLPDVAVIFDAQLRYQFVNTEGVKRSGYSLEQLLGRTDAELFPPAIADLYVPMLQRCLNTQTLQSAEIDFDLPNYGKSTLIVTYVPVMDEQGEVHQILGLTQDITERKRSEAALRESEERYRSLVIATSSIVARADGEGAIIEAPLWEFFTGQTFEDYQGFGWLRAVHPDDRPFVLERCLQARRSKTSCTIEYQLLHHSGYYRYVSMQTVPILNRDGSIREWIGTVTDINQRKQAEAALRESEERFRQIAENINQFFFIRSARSREYLYISPAYETIWGRSCESLYENPESWLETVYPEDRALVQQSIDEQLQGKPVQREYRIIASDRSIRWVIAHIFPVFNEAGQLVRHAGLVEDITDRKLAEEAIRQSEEQLRSVLQQMPVMLDALDQAGNIIVWNQECERVTGYTAAEIIGNPQAMHLLYPDLDYQKSMTNELRRRGQNYRNWEWNITCKDGSVKTIEWSNISEEFPIAGWTSWAIGMDVSARKQAEAEVLNALEQERQLNELKSQFISMVSHEFRTPLSIILSSTELLQHYSQHATPEQQQTRYRRILEAVDRMSQLLDAVLLIGKAEAGKLQFNPAPLDLVEFCQELLEELRLTSKHSHPLLFSYNGDRPLLWLDRQLLRHILTNLVSNAIKYSPAGSEVWLSLIHQEQTVILQVSDRGIGISTTDQEQLFTIFKRGENVGTISGTGLGLAIVKQCVELHRGSIAIESELGAGTVVTVTLPFRRVSEL